jgi:nucleotide-binding universal stress UspA family protein
MGKIYVPVSGSYESRKAVQKAASLAKSFGLEIVALGVINRELISKLERYQIFIQEESSLFVDNVRKNSEKYLSHAKRLGQEAGVKVTSVLLEGDPYHEFVDYVNQDKEELKLVCIGKKEGGDGMKDIYSDLERKLLLFAPFNIIVIGEIV